MCKSLFMTGNLFKYSNNGWKEIISTDTADCICSVKSTGSWKEFVDIIIEIGTENNCIAFATHGGYLFNVDDSSQYQVGDIVLNQLCMIRSDKLTYLAVNS